MTGRFYVTLPFQVIICTCSEHWQVALETLTGQRDIQIK
jgi:hypothetical protein